MARTLALVWAVTGAVVVSTPALAGTEAPGQPVLKPVKIAVVPLRLPRALETDRTRIEEGAAAGLTGAGVIAQLGDPTGCEYTLSGTVTRSKDQFTMRLVLVRVVDGVEIDAASRMCRDEYDLCPATVDIARDLAGRLGRKLLLDLNTQLLTEPPPVDASGAGTAGGAGAAGAGTTGSLPGVPGANGGGGAGAPGTVLTPPGGDTESHRWPRKKLAMVGAAASALAILAGTALYFGLNDRKTDCQHIATGEERCFQLWDTTALSAVLVGVGVVGLGASGWLMWGRF